MGKCNLSAFKQVYEPTNSRVYIVSAISHGSLNNGGGISSYLHKYSWVFMSIPCDECSQNVEMEIKLNSSVSNCTKPKIAKPAMLSISSSPFR